MSEQKPLPAQDKRVRCAATVTPPNGVQNYAANDRLVQAPPRQCTRWARVGIYCRVHARIYSANSAEKDAANLRIKSESSAPQYRRRREDDKPKRTEIVRYSPEEPPSTREVPVEDVDERVDDELDRRAFGE